MARTPDDKPRKRFSRSGHTSHQPRMAPSDTPTAALQPPQPAPQPGPPQQPPPYQHAPGYSGPTYHHATGAGPAATGAGPAATGAGPAAAGAGAAAASAGSKSASVTKAAVTRTNQAARGLTRRIIDASKAGGADESGLTALIWNQVLSYGTDAMITVALAGTVFFGASPHAQRGNVLLYLLITMAPFAAIAPVIGPALDRLQHGRRWTMAGTAMGRGVLALVMAGHPTELLVLYPCALGSLVLSKAYAVLRAAAAPRLVPPGMTLVQANARLSIFGLASTLVLGTSIGIVIKATGSYTFGLLVTAIAFGVCAYFAVKLPRQIDSPQSITSGGQVRNTRPKAEAKMRPMRRFLGWATQNFDADLIIALQAEAVLRFMAGALTIFLAFWVEAGAHGMIAALQLGAVIGAAGFGNFTGTAIGTRIKLARPNRLILASLAVAAVVSIVVALLFTVGLAIIGMFICSVANAQSKIALDSLIQRDVPEAQRSSAFGRSETFLQLAWVFGAAVGVVLPTGVGGAVVFWVIGGVAAAVAVIALLRTRAIARAGAAHEAREPRTRPGTVAGDPNAR